MATPAKITYDLNDGTLSVDGTPFPWEITTEGPLMQYLTDREGMCSVMVSIYAETVEIIPKEPEEP